jgi:hypothetical protein
MKEFDIGLYLFEKKFQFKLKIILYKKIKKKKNINKII